VTRPTSSPSTDASSTNFAAVKIGLTTTPRYTPRRSSRALRDHNRTARPSSTVFDHEPAHPHRGRILARWLTWKAGESGSTPARHQRRPHKEELGTSQASISRCFNKPSKGEPRTSQPRRISGLAHIEPRSHDEKTLVSFVATSTRPRRHLLKALQGSRWQRDRHAWVNITGASDRPLELPPATATSACPRRRHVDLLTTASDVPKIGTLGLPAPRPAAACY